ncbi:MAG: hypothetical protein RLY20_642 [Verrucomicrobiota bacterium]
MGIRERSSDLNARSEQMKKSGKIIRVHKLGRVEHVEYTDPVVHVQPPDGTLINDPGGGAQTFTNAFLGATLADTSAYPPDTMGAVGPSQFIVAVNGRIRTFNKTTGLADGAVNADTDAFFSSVMTPPTSVNFTSDPRIRFDRLTGRWFIIMLDVPNGTGTVPNRIMFAVSDGPVISGSTVWTFFQFQHDQPTPQNTADTGNFADYPTLGIDANALYIGVNVFSTSGVGSFVNTTVFCVRKSSLLGGGPIVVTPFRKLISNGPSGGPYTPQGVDNFDPAATEGYVIGADAKQFGKLQLRRISNPGGSPTISGNISITLPTINGSTINVPHLGNTGGTAGNLDGLDYRLLAAHYRNGRLWTTENLGVDSSGTSSGGGATPNRMGVRWYELTGIPTGQTPSVFQSGTLYDPSPSTTTNRNFWMGSVMVSGQGHAAMGFSVAGPSEYVNAGTCGRMKNDAAGTMRSPKLYTASSSAYNPRDNAGNPIERWGDYSYTCLDPSDDMTMWTIQEFCVSPNYYGVQIAKLLAPKPATPASCDPASLAQGTNNATVTLTGTSDGDTGFFDPGAGFSNRIAAAVSGTGVTVNSITYNNPTNVTLNLSVAAGATTGGRNLTVTNPDGQSATSLANILTILGASVPTNNPPSLPAIAAKTVIEGDLLTFTNAATDPDGNALTYTLVGAPSGASVTNGGVFTWTPTEAQGPSTNSLAMIVTDNGSPSLSATQNFTVIVLETNAAPTLPAIASFVIIEGNTLVFTNAASDADLPANTLTYSLSGAPSGASVTNGGVFTWTPTEAQGPSTNSLAMIVTDNGSPSLSATQNFTVIVLETNAAPTLPLIAAQTVVEGDLLTFTNVATDNDLPANALTYSLLGAPSGAAVTNGVFTWTPTEAQGPSTNVIAMVVTDNGVPSLSATQSFTVIVLETNTAPVLAGIPDFVVIEGATITFTNAASDADLPANPLTYALSGAPAGASVSVDGVFTWNTTEADGPGTNVISFIVADNGAPSLSATQSFTVIVLETNSAPTLPAISDRVIAVGSLLTFTNLAADTDLPANNLTYSLAAAPLGAAVTNGIFTWTPVGSQSPGTNVIAMIVTDDGIPSLSTTQSFTVIVVNSNTAPSLAAISDRVLHATMTLVITNSAADTDVPANALTYSLDPGAPPAATIGATNGLFLWTPADADAGTTNAITVRVTDDGVPPLSATRTFNVLVVSRPVITSVALSNDIPVVNWSAINGRGYRLQATPQLEVPAWLDLSGDVTADGPTASATDPDNVTTNRYYRVRVLP